MACSDKARGAGFTLIELLVAITVLALVAVLGYRGLDNIVRTRVALTTEMEQMRNLQLAFAQLQNDCSKIATATDLPGRQAIVADGGRLLILRHTEVDNQAPEFEVVVYRVLDGQLTRQESAATRDPQRLDQLWHGALTQSGESGLVRLQSGIKEMTLRAWVNGGWEASLPLLTPDQLAASPPPPPAALELQLQLKARANGVVKVFTVGPA